MAAPVRALLLSRESSGDLAEAWKRQTAAKRRS
jgi:hypothetical protein